MSDSHNQSFNKLADQFTRYLLRLNPVNATYLGVHDHDEDLPSYSAGVLKKKIERLESFKKQFRNVKKIRLSPDNKIDLELALGHIETELLIHKKFPPHKLLPDLYLNDILFGVYVLISREFAPDRVRALAATRRLAAVPGLLRQARTNLKNVPGVFVDSALYTCSGAIAFLKDSVPAFSGQIRGSLKEALLEANDEAIGELVQFGEYMEEKLLPKAKDNYAVGKVLYNQLLKHRHHLPYNSNDLLKIARKSAKSIETELKKTAKTISKKKDWKEIIEDLKNSHPSTQGLLGTYKREIKRARDFVVSNDLATIVEDESIDVMQTPAFAKALIPYAAYINPAPMENSVKGTFWVSVPFGMTTKEAKQRLKGHSKWKIPLIALHEAYPGHHLQFTHANQGKSLIRHLATTSVFAEGWALYCEDLMWRQGFIKDPKQRLLQLKESLWRAYRVILDVGLHTKTIKFTHAVNILVDKCGLEEPHAEAEVRRYCQTPTQPMSYLIGMNEINELLEVCKKKAGKGFSLKEFHDDLLSKGTIPVSMIQRLMKA